MLILVIAPVLVKLWTDDNSNNFTGSHAYTPFYLGIISLITIGSSIGQDMARPNEEYGQLSTEEALLKIAIQPLNLTIEMGVNGG